LADESEPIGRFEFEGLEMAMFRAFVVVAVAKCRIIAGEGQFVGDVLNDGKSWTQMAMRATAAAEVAAGTALTVSRLTVLHVDEDFDVIVAITDQPIERLGPSAA
jgi:hypothetical protein